MDLTPTARTQELQRELSEFITERVDPAYPVYRDQVAASGDPHFHPPIMEELKTRGTRTRALEPLPPRPR